jgi:hypothetical protein
MIKVGYLKDENSHYVEPDTRAAMLGHAALDYYRACALADEHQWQENGLPFFSFLLPTMHQTLELVAKAIAYKSDRNFNPKKYSHHTLSVLADYAATVPVFASIASDPDNVDLISALETAYLGVRYGECHTSYDGDTWSRFVTISAALFADLSTKTGLRFPMAHRLP